VVRLQAGRSVFRIPVWRENLFLLRKSTLHLKPLQYPIQWVPAIFLGGKAVAAYVDIEPPSSAAVRVSGATPLFFLYAFMAWKVQFYIFTTTAIMKFPLFHILTIIWIHIIDLLFTNGLLYSI
jgi:hypothetical protein